MLHTLLRPQLSRAEPSLRKMMSQTSTASTHRRARVREAADDPKDDPRDAATVAAVIEIAVVVIADAGRVAVTEDKVAVITAEVVVEGNKAT